MMRGDKGFTLIEILISLAIFSAIATVAYTRLGDIARHLNHIENQVFALWVAENTLTQLSINPRAQSFQGTFTQQYQMANRRWFVEVNPESTQVNGFYRLNVTVYLTGDDVGKERIVSLYGFGWQAI